jgi:hypothetical protein
MKSVVLASTCVCICGNELVSRQYGYLHKQLSIIGPRRFDTPSKVRFADLPSLQLTDADAPDEPARRDEARQRRNA